MFVMFKSANASKALPPRIHSMPGIAIAILVIVQPSDPVLGYADSSGAGFPMRNAVIAATRNSSAFRF
jgi:hypothetical protein